MRLYDLIASKRMALNSYAMEGMTRQQAFETMRTLRDGIMGAARIDITNVAEYLYAGSDQEEWEWNKDFPNLAPPFDRFWMEFETPEFIRSTEFGERRNTNLTTYGFYFSSTPHDDGWVLSGALFSREKHSEDGKPYAVGPNIQWFSRIAPDGTIVGGAPTLALPYTVPDEWRQQIEEAGHGAGSLFFPVGLALSFMHCKNVVLEDAPDTRTRQQRRYDERKGTKPAEFKTLVIEPMKQVLKTEGGSERHGLQKALHICRGHFAVYTEEKPLFGRIVGPVWRQAHVRGSADVGMVGKDYRVKAPAQ